MQFAVYRFIKTKSSIYAIRAALVRRGIYKSPHSGYYDFVKVFMGVRMISLIAGIIFIAFTVFALLPSFPLNWSADVLAFLRGCLPVLAALVGLICLFIGVADIKDKKEAAREEREAREREEKK